ncbi:MBL fold metallo-hydrolase [Kiritimatiellaeota bacterium B1221]|nr:MBL fold metallo-hydrolase [Kiritimatiellaeota bacterium B1221]
MHYPILHSGLLKGDNYGYFVQTGPREVLAVDAPEGRVMLEILKHKSWTLKALLLTHTHHDHVVYLEELLQKTGCAFFHPEGAEVPGGGRGVTDGESFEVNGLRVQALDTSGHSDLDFSYWFPDLDLCFCGDTLFASGCGRMFAGPPERFWASLKRLRELPEATRICCGHDYLGDNLRFVRQTFPNLPVLRSVEGWDVMPLRLAVQRKCNPFLMADDPRIAVSMGLEGADPAMIFKKLRELRNQL